VRDGVTRLPPGHSELTVQVKSLLVPLRVCGQLVAGDSQSSPGSRRIIPPSAIACSVKTGMLCSYAPDPRASVVWTL
jgi:hypothetical protein